MTLRLDLWHNHAQHTGGLPKDIEGLSMEEVEDHLGFCRSARYRAMPKLHWPEGWVEQEQQGNDTVTHYRFPERTLHSVERCFVEQQQAGMRGQMVKYPIASEDECRAFLNALSCADLKAPVDGFAEFDQQTGDAGLPLLILGPGPAHFVMLNLLGYENAYYAMADYPDVLDALITAIEEKFRAQVWDTALQTTAELVLHGVHFSDDATPPPLFRKYFQPYFTDFVQAAHRTGKRVVWHADAAVGSLMGEVLEIGFDGADCLATWPLVQQTLQAYHGAWRGRIVCWGGLPGTVLHPEYPRREFEVYLDGLTDYSRGCASIIIAASDNVMPGGEWERILAVSERFCHGNDACVTVAPERRRR
ncbi:MAG: hypothetical protein AUJ92_07765 [Armatimonadetes bacterium CG2_30_59_28]|nr:hypothetical protein [Armatimonadota bacterium]OIO95537.1 MAG: hypothetical protein AUJ92_07765 [Armatimonadetes bacterium CG2_30_59_28]PIU66950.1 MAG: hypothetical protein COS85_02610 [Armatimonadetes bacterium CG07_land_8_20_14_0_80_59_28]PIX41162.1 MAG: hypothetical protein COZ56_12805 [Armatimonadetes bacterium CG_4_8_14_3_um_filter_58_9]PIY43885.1 MAG: hypothetical protein COZ05_09775 [Armatimonadetes bacterium CG_4_10_14_3_um_filter_59_10]PJB63885.1 MAG: hypothetical protein CO095_155